MSTYKTISITRTGDGAVTFDPAVTKWRLASYPANAQVSIQNLPVGATFNVDIRPAGHVEFKRHITDATPDDLVMLSGKEAPLFSAVKLTASNTSGAEITAYITLWERGI